MKRILCIALCVVLLSLCPSAGRALAAASAPGGMELRAWCAANGDYVLYVDEEGIMRLDRQAGKWERLYGMPRESGLLIFQGIDERYLYFQNERDDQPWPDGWPEGEPGWCRLWRIEIGTGATELILDSILGEAVVGGQFIFYVPQVGSVYRCDRQGNNAEPFVTMGSNEAIFRDGDRMNIGSDAYTLDGEALGEVAYDTDAWIRDSIRDGKQYVLDVPQYGEDHLFREIDTHDGSSRVVCTMVYNEYASVYLAGGWAFFYDDVAGYGHYFNQYLGKCPLSANGMRLEPVQRSDDYPDQEAWDQDAQDDGDAHAHEPTYVPVYFLYGASSTLPADTNRGISYDAYQLGDDDLDTAWVEGASGNGLGESVVISTTQPVRAVGFVIYAGYGKSSDLYRKNARVKILDIFADGLYVASYLLEDVEQYQRIFFDESVEASYVEFRISSVYKGSKYEDTCISELQLMTVSP